MNFHTDPVFMSTINNLHKRWDGQSAKKLFFHALSIAGEDKISWSKDGNSVCIFVKILTRDQNLLFTL